ncbi:MAG: serine hydrolase domain-containing protein [Rhodoferax sp.]|nr:serine hydrolase domain-containing protein [Rhodoferax sp.]
MRHAFATSLALLLFGAAAGPLQAQTWYQMNTPDKVKSGLLAHENAQRKVHWLQPAKEVRALPVASANPNAARLEGEAKTFAKSTFGTVIVERGEIIFEQYSQGADAQTLMNAYSVTKSWTALAVGEAFCAGKIKSLDDLAATYAPALDGTAYGQATIRQLLEYVSGAEDPGGTGYVGIHDTRAFNGMVEYKSSLADLAKRFGGNSRFKPGEKFVYNGMDSNALSLVVRGATGMSMPAWFESTVWQKAGGESPAAWFLDSDGNGIGEILLFATTRDYARVGLYVLDRLNNQAGSDCSREFVQQAAKPLREKAYWKGAPHSGYGLHVGDDGHTWMFGFAGQRVGVQKQLQRVLATNSDRDLPTTNSGSQGLLSR